jgi:hypothetical protein
MGDMGDYFNDVKDYHRERRAAFGVNCPKCRLKQPKRTPSILLPQQRCKVDGYRDPRPRIPDGISSLEQLEKLK